jgi:hypothetical protein
MWKDRDDLPDFAELRRSWDATFGTVRKRADYCCYSTPMCSWTTPGSCPRACSSCGALSDRTIVSAVTVAELYAGVREGRERAALEPARVASNIVTVDAQIAEQGGLLARQYRPSHGTGSPTRSSPRPP